MVLIFFAVENNLLWREGIRGALAAVPLNAVFIIAVYALYVSHSRNSCGKLRRWSLGLDLFLFFLLTIPPALLTFITPQKGKPDFVWLPLEWHKLPENVVLLARISPGVAAAEICAVAVLIFLFCRGGLRLVPRLAAAALFVVVFKQLFVLSKESNIIFYFCQYASMPLIAALAGALGKRRVFARALMASTFTCMLLWQYIGVVPINPRPARMPDPSISVVYPRAGKNADFPLVFFRDFQLDAKRNMLFTAYGPTSGLVRLNLADGKVDIATTHAGLVRYLWTRDDMDIIYAIDWIACDLLIVNKDKFGYTRHSIYRPEASIPLALEVAGGRLYVSSTERPGLAEYDLKTLRLTRSLDIMPFTKFRSGVWRMSYDAARDALFIELGYTDLRGRNLLLRVDRKTMKVDGRAEIPAGGLEILVIPEKRRIISASFFTGALWEFDMDTMKLARRIEGPVNCRNMAYDPRRDMLYATSFLGGDLRAIDYSSGRTERTVRLGNKASSLFLSPDEERRFLYLGNSWGVLKVDLEKFLPGRAARANSRVSGT